MLIKSNLIQGKAIPLGRPKKKKGAETDESAKSEATEEQKVKNQPAVQKTEEKSPEPKAEETTEVKKEEPKEESVKIEEKPAATEKPVVAEPKSEKTEAKE